MSYMLQHTYSKELVSMRLLEDLKTRFKDTSSLILLVGSGRIQREPTESLGILIGVI